MSLRVLSSVDNDSDTQASQRRADIDKHRIVEAAGVQVLSRMANLGYLC